MDSKFVSDIFYIRLYHWLLHEIHDEVSHNFPIMRQVKSVSALEIIEIIESTPHQERLQLASTIIRRVYQENHPDILEKISTPWNKNDEVVWKTFQRKRDIIDKFKWLKEYQDLETRFPVRTRLLKEALLQSLSLLKETQLFDKGYHLSCISEFGNWIIETSVELWRPPRQPLNFYHVIRGRNGWNLTRDKIDLLSYLRIYSSWDLLTMQDLPQAINTVSTLCSKFLDALPQLLEGISEPEISWQEAKIYTVKNITQTFQEEFKVRFYHWSLKDAEREVQESFPFVQRISNDWAFDALAAMQNLDFLSQFKAAKALVKYVNWDYLSRDEILTDDEITILLSSRYDIRLASNASRKPNTSGQPESFSQKELKAFIKKRLKPILGSVCQPDSNDWKHQLVFNDWQIRTGIAIDEGLSYVHQISDSQTGTLTIGSAHILGWLGIGETYWTFSSAVEAAEAVEALADVCEHFMKALPEILTGLTTDRFIEIVKRDRPSL